MVSGKTCKPAWAWREVRSRCRPLSAEARRALSMRVLLIKNVLDGRRYHTCGAAL